MAGFGDVIFAPSISGAVGSLADPLVINTPSPVAFQFTEASNTFFLGQGVGNLNDPPPFTLSTNNGVLQVGGVTGPSLGAFIGGDKKLAATLTPSAEGSATVSVAGPCGLQGSVVAAVVTAKIEVTKTVGTVAGVCASTQSIQVAQNTPVYYCVTVKNAGVVDLNYHEVSDPLLGVTLAVTIPLAPGAEVAVTNLLAAGLGPVTANAPITNTVVVTSFPSSTALNVSASASSQAKLLVVAPKIVVTKTVGTVPGACATTNNVTIQAGSPVFYCITIHNTGDIPLLQHTVDDSMFSAALGGPQTIDYPLMPGATVVVTQVNGVLLSPGAVTTNIENLVTVTSSVELPLVQPTVQDVAAAAIAPVTAKAVAVGQSSASLAVVPPKIEVTKTVGTVAGVCAATQSIQVAQNTLIYYCVTVKNVGIGLLTYHLVSDPLLGVTIPVTYPLGPGEKLEATNALFPVLGPIPAIAAITNTVVITSFASQTAVNVSASAVSQAGLRVIITPPTALDVEAEPDFAELTNRVYLPVISR